MGSKRKNFLQNDFRPWQPPTMEVASATAKHVFGKTEEHLDLFERKNRRKCRWGGFGGA